jgi:nucleoside-diphosphate-sugar epimerase
VARVLVTGAAGFIGSALAARLLDEGHDVTGLDSLSPSYSTAIKRANLAALRPDGFRFLHLDLASDDIDAAVADAEAIVHLAGRPGVRSSWGADFESYLHDNVLGTQRLLEATVRAGSTARLVHASSSSVYGQHVSVPTIETAPLHPYSPYGTTKLSAEHLVEAYAANFGVRAVALRLFTVYGPGQRPDMAFQKFLSAIAAGEPVALYGSGDHVRDFTYVDDVVAAIRRALEHDGVLPPALNIAGGASTSVNEVLALLGEITGTPVAIERHPPALGDVDRTEADSSLARTMLDWAPQVGLREGIERQWKRTMARRVAGAF